MRRPVAQIPRGAHITGIVTLVTDTYTYVNIGATVSGRIPIPPDAADPPEEQVGQRIPVIVTAVDAAERTITLHRRGPTRAAPRPALAPEPGDKRPTTDERGAPPTGKRARWRVATTNHQTDSHPTTERADDGANVTDATADVTPDTAGPATGTADTTDGRTPPGDNTETASTTPPTTPDRRSDPCATATPRPNTGARDATSTGDSIILVDDSDGLPLMV